MNRQRSGAHQRAYPDHGKQSRVIGLRAVAAAIRYQGDANNAERVLTRDVDVPATAVTQTRDTKA